VTWEFYLTQKTALFIEFIAARKFFLATPRKANRKQEGQEGRDPGFQFILDMRAYVQASSCPNNCQYNEFDMDLHGSKTDVQNTARKPTQLIAEWLL